MNKGQVSVVIAVRDGARFLRQAIESARSQTYPSIEVIVVDDGSGDNSAAVAASCAVDRLVVLPKSQGVSSARNIGTALAGGEFVTFLDADDRFAPAKVAAQVACLADHPDCQCVLVQQDLDIEAGVELPAWLRPVLDGSTVLAPAPMSALVRTSRLYQAGGFDPSYRVAEDTEWLLRLIRRPTDVFQLDDRSYHRRIHGDNASYDVAASRQALFRALRSKIRAAPQAVTSVVVPVHNGASFLPSAIASIRDQSGDVSEIVIVDDGSTDRSLDVAMGLAAQDPRIIVATQPRAGPGAARNHGVLLAHASLLAFLDADDVWRPGKLAAQLDVLAADPTAEVVMGWMAESVEHGCPAGVSARPPQPVSHASVALLRRETFARVGPFRADPMSPEWLDWWMRAEEAGVRTTTLSSVLAVRRLHADNHSRRVAMLERNAYGSVLREGLLRRRAVNDPT